MSYKTSQKQAIFDFVITSKTHPTADEVFQAVQRKLPTIGFATVYRNLAALAKEGKIKEVQFVDKKKRYEGNTHQHQHFICTACNRIIDMELTALLNIEDAVQKMQCHQVEDYKLELMGVCASCKED
jgi:Fur family peroxide stress response transcriptional regulator